MPQILLVRHGQASFGGDDYDVLSPAGHRQAAALRDELARRGVRPARVVSGSLRRQIDTARPIAEPELDARWNEYDSADLLGAHSGSPLRLDRTGGGTPPVDQARFQRVLEAGMDAWIAAAAGSPAAEPWPAFRARVEAALADLGERLGKGEVGVVATSGGVIATAAVIALSLPDAAMPAFNRVSVNASITKLAIGRSGTSLVSYNEHGHLEGPDAVVTFR